MLPGFAARPGVTEVGGISQGRIGGGVRDFRRLHVCTERTAKLDWRQFAAQQVRNGDGASGVDCNCYQHSIREKPFVAHGSISILARRRWLRSLGVFCRSDFRFSPHVADCHTRAEVSDGALRFMKRGSTILHGAPLFQACTLPGPSPGLY